MRSSEREDWLLRQARAIAAMVSRILGLRSAGDYDEARAELEKAHAELGGAQSDLLRRADPATAAILLGSPDRVELFARLLDEEAALSEDPARVDALRTKAMEMRRIAAGA